MAMKTASEKKPDFVHLCLEVEDMEAFVDKCLASGLSVKQVPKGDSLLVFVEDYDKNLFEIKPRSP